MEILRFISITIIFFYGIVFFCNSVESCNEIVCASIVSKCMLTQSCKCEFKNCSCCEECVKCLGKKYYDECCSCVDLCPKPNDTRSSLSKKSHVENFDGVPELFNVISAQAETLEWESFTFPIDFDTILSGPKLEKDFKYYLKSNDENMEDSLKEGDNNLITVNCTVIYLDQCTSLNKCRENCRSTGASSYRWFHDGCCECVGPHCINYGVNESRCKRCPDSKDADDEDIDEDLQDFGDSMGPFDGSVNNN